MEATSPFTSGAPAGLTVFAVLDGGRLVVVGIGDGWWAGIVARLVTGVKVPDA
jgi:hypothetical protein